MDITIVDEEPELEFDVGARERWDEAVELADELSVETVRPAHETHELWYCPTVTLVDVQNIAALFEEHGIENVYDLGAGDCRFSLWCAENGYNAVAYELNPELVTAVRDAFDVDGFELRSRDYYADFEELVGPKTAVVCFGGTNPLPHVPSEGVAVEGYWERGVRAFHAGECVAHW